MNLRSSFAAVIFAAVGTVAAQDSLSNKKPYEAAAHFADDSLVKITVLQSELKVQTEFGLLDIPFERIRKIDFGVHYSDGEEKRISDSIRDLGSSAYRDRDIATKYLLSSKPFVYPMLKKAAEKTGDAEFAHRAASLVDKFKEKFKAKPLLLSPREEDIVHTDKFPVVGRVLGKELKARSRNFGNHDIKFSDLKSIYWASETEREILIDASKYGSASDQWLDTGVDITENAKLAVKADGQVDIWPQGPGQYLTTPKGYTTAGKGSPYMAGALVGKIANQEKAFLIGEQHDGIPTGEGRLFLHIVPSPWNNASTGSYRVRIATSYALTR